ncbi:MAG: thiolase family protein [Nocardioidaceae bacterium]
MTTGDDRASVLVSAARTPIGRFGGALRHLDAVDLGAAAVAGALDPLDGLVPDHVFLGNVVQAGNGQNPARVAGVRAGLPTTVPATTVNDVCLASMTATGMAASMIRGGELDSAVVGGFDSMSRALHGLQVREAARAGDATAIDLLVRDGLWCALVDRGMGDISDEANQHLGIDRADQDAVAVESHRRADAATRSGRLGEEIDASRTSPLKVDEGIRPGTSADGLSRLTAAFVEGGTITAGNASQMSDAGAAGVLMSLGMARALGLRPLVEVVDRVVVAGPDSSLHLKPAAAARLLLERHGLTVEDIGLWEVNEAFAGVVVASARDLGLDLANVNVNGGAIAVGHPLGASGFRLLQTLGTEMNHRSSEYGIAAICGGGGQGQAMLLRLR